MGLSPAPKPSKQSKTERRRAAAERRSSHYGGADDWPALKERVFRRDRWACFVPGCKRNAFSGHALECAHIQSVGMGGAPSGGARSATISDERNLVTLCHEHHTAFDQGPARATLREQVTAKLEALYNRLECA